NTDSSGFWDDPTNWLDAQGKARVPGASDDVSIDRTPAIPTVTIRADQTANSVVSASPLALTAGSLTVAAPSELRGGFSLVNATIVTNGAVTASGSSTWTSGLILGAGGLTNSGTLTLAGADKALTSVLHNVGTVVRALSAP